MITADKIRPFSKEQYDFLINSTARINIATGPVRSGKNFIENVRLLAYLLNEPEDNRDSSIAFCGASINAIYNIFLSDLLDMVGSENYVYNSNNGSGTIYGRPFQCFPCQKSGDFKRLRGRTIGGALITEGTLCDKEFFNELLARLSIKGAKLFIDTNPAGPYHWLYSDFMTNEQYIADGRVKVFQFNFDSNLSLDDEYKESLKAYYGPGTLWYQRMIEGLWVMADGLVYSKFDPRAHVIPRSSMPASLGVPDIGYDYGTSNPFAGLQGHFKGGIWYMTRGLYYSGKERGQLSDGEKADMLTEWVDPSTKRMYLDPSALSFKTELRKHAGFKQHRISVRNANNSVNEGIEYVNSLFGAGKILIAEGGGDNSCIDLIKELGIYAWDKNASKRGEDKPKKENDHAADALRYLIYSAKKGNKKGGNWV